MAYEIPGFSFTLPAGADLTSSLFRGVTTNSSGKVVAPGAGQAIIGVINNKPDTNEAATIVHSGIAQVEAGAAITLSSNGTPVKVDSSGRVVPQSTSGVCVGWALEAASGSGIIISVLLAPGASAPLSTTVVGDQNAITALTDSTSATANNTVENVPAATAAVTDTTAASLTSVNTALTALENNDADLTAKVNAILSALVAAGVLTA